jgi:hypothetical protein
MADWREARRTEVCPEKKACASCDVLRDSLYNYVDILGDQHFADIIIAICTLSVKLRNQGHPLFSSCH